MKKLLSLLLAAAVAVTSAVIFAGCAGTEYPVEVANIKIEKEPENIVVLDANAADIIAFMGYDGKIVGRSDQVNQTDLAAAPSVGDSSNPSVGKIKDSGATVVFASGELSASSAKSLEADGIKVVSISFAETQKQLQSSYTAAGKILGGKISGSVKGEESYKRLIDELKQIQSSIPVDPNSKNTPDTVCYLYSEGDNLKIMTQNTYGEMLLKYTNCENIAAEVDEDTVDVQLLNKTKPKYIFYSDAAVLKAIKTDPVISKLPAVRDNNVLQITENEMKRQGGTAVNTVKRMVDFVYKGKRSNPNETTDAQAQQATQNVKVQQATQATQAQQATKAAQAQQATKAAQAQQATQATQAARTQQATQAAQEAGQTGTSVAAQYKITLTGVSLKKEDENANVKIMQKRLYDLGYIEEADNVTGYYGDVSEKAVQQFQQANGMKGTGTADNATLLKLFDKTAKKAG